MKNVLLFLAILGTCSGCTMAITLTNTSTHGYASDVVDETTSEKADADLDADATIPAFPTI